PFSFLMSNFYFSCSRGKRDRVVHPLSGGRARTFRQLPALDAAIAERFRELVRARTQGQRAFARLRRGRPAFVPPKRDYGVADGDVANDQRISRGEKEGGAFGGVDPPNRG